MALLTGEYKHQLDAKNRIRIPARLKKELGDEYCFAKGDHHCLYVYPQSEMDAKLEAVKQTKLSEVEKQKNLRAFMRTITPATEDGQGRIVLSPELRDHLAFSKNEKDIVVIGVGDRAEIWSKSNYDAYFADVSANYDDVIANLDF